MTETQNIALDRALRLLVASGVHFAVVEPDGTKHGDLTVVDPNARSSMPRLSKKYEWHAACDALQMGESFRLEAETAEDALRLAANMKSRAHRLWGSGSYITATSGNFAELLRM